MGVIERQSIKNTAVKYVGIVVSVLATFLVYSRYKEAYGLYTFLFSGASLLSAVALLGSGSIALKFHPLNLRSEERYEHLFVFLLFLFLAGMSLLTIMFLVFRGAFEDFFIQSEDSYLIRQFLIYLLPLTFFVSFNGLLITYIANYKRIVIPQLFGDFFMRLALPILVLAVGLDWISLNQFLNLLLLFFAAMSTGLLIYLRMFEPALFSWPTFMRRPGALKRVFTYGSFALFESISGMLAVRIDTLMVAKMIDLTNAGAYAILLFLTNVALIPMKSIFSISGPIIANRLDDGDLQEVERVYKSSSIVLLIAGCLISGLILLNVQDLIVILPKSDEFTGFMGVTLFLCLANVVDMSTSLNTHIIVFSKYYWTNLFMVMLLAVVNIALNFYLIPIYGLTGAAISTCVSLTIYNLAKLILIYGIFRIQPFSRNSIYVGCSAMILFGLVAILPDTSLELLNMVYRTFLFGGSFVVVTYYFSFSMHFNGAVDGFVNKVRQRLTS